MQDKPYDDDFDEEFDDAFEDVPYDEDWDGFDTADDDAAVLPPSSRKKSGFGAFLFRIFSFCLILLFVGLAGIFVYNKYGAALFRIDEPATPASEIPADSANLEITGISPDNTPVEAMPENNADDADQTVDGLPPMPLPIDSQSFETSDSMSDADEDINAGFPDLTPLPDPDDIIVEMLPELDIAPQEESIAPGFPDIDNPAQPEITAQNNGEDQDSTDSLVNENLSNENKALTVKLTQSQNALNQAQARIRDLEAQLQNRPKIVQNVVKTPAKTTRSAKPAPKKTTSRPVNNWTLRSAKEGQAVISRKGSDTLRTVTVGATVSGIGRITAISNASGKWVVQGTQGRISQ